MNPEWNECRESVIELKEEPCCIQVFPQFLKYLYVGQIRISLTAVMPMLALADKYNIKVNILLTLNIETDLIINFIGFYRIWYSCVSTTC